MFFSLSMHIPPSLSLALNRTINIDKLLIIGKEGGKNRNVQVSDKENDKIYFRRKETEIFFL